MSKNEKLVALIAGGIIVYELWKRSQAAQAATGSSFVADTTSNIPVWAQQLSALDTSNNVVSTEMDDAVSTLMNLPQGPGGSYVNYGYGTPGGGIFGSQCLLMPTAMGQ